MTVSNRFRLGAVALLGLGVALASPAGAQNYPSQRVTIVVPFGAGSVTDILARIFSEEMGRRWNQQVIVENRPGIPGTAAVAKAAPDGLTLMVTSNGHTVSGVVTKNPTFDPVKDFAGITRLGSAPLFMIAHPDVKPQTVKDIIAAAKAEPGKLSFSSPGLASSTFLAGAQFRRAAGINLLHVPYRSSPDAVTAVMRGDANFYFAPVNLARDQSQAGKVRAVAAATPTRLPELPDTPTFKEAGLDFTYDSWFGLMAPAQTPKPILEKIAKDWAEAAKTPEMQAKIKAQFMIIQSDTPAAFDKIIATETAELTKVFQDSGLAAQ